MGGWLAFLVIALVVIGPFLTIGTFYGEFSHVQDKYPALAESPNWVTYERSTWFVVAISISLSILAGYKLLRERGPSTVVFTKYVLWLNLPLASLMNGFVLPAVFFSPFNEHLIGSTVGAFVGGCIGALIWTSYLSYSVRVRNTYGLAQN